MKAEIHQSADNKLYEVWINDRRLSWNILSEKTAEEVKKALIKEREK